MAKDPEKDWVSLRVRVRPWEYKVIAWAADRDMRSLTTFVRAACMEKVNRVQGDSRFLEPPLPWEDDPTMGEGDNGNA